MELKVNVHNKAVKFDDISEGGYASVKLYATEMQIAPGQDGKPVIVYKTGVSFDIPEGHVGLILQEPSINAMSIDMVEGVSVVFPGDTNEISLKFKTNVDVVPVIYKEGDPIARMILVPNVIFTIKTENLFIEEKELEKDAEQPVEENNDSPSVLEEK